MNRGRRPARAPRCWYKALTVALLAGLLSGCETVPESAQSVAVDDPAAAFDTRQAVLGNIQHWFASGRLALATASESTTASVRWEQRAAGYTIRLTGPLGAGAVELRGTDGQVSLKADGKEHRAPDADTLLREVAGLELPVNGLRYWLMGLAAPGQAVAGLRFDNGGRLEYLEQAGWKIRYLRYGKTELLDMPTKLFMDSAQVRARVVVQEWGFKQAS